MTFLEYLAARRAVLNADIAAADSASDLASLSDALDSVSRAETLWHLYLNATYGLPCNGAPHG